MRSLILASLLATLVAPSSFPRHVTSGLDPTLVDAGAYGLIRVATTSSAGRAGSADCLSSDGNKAFRPDKTFTVDPTDPTHLFVAIEYLGFFISNDSGATWRHSSSGLIGYARNDDATRPCIDEMSDFTLDPQDPRHMLLLREGESGTITSYFGENQGVFESRDGGVTWRQIMKTPGINIATHDGVKFAPTDPRIIYTGTTTAARGGLPDDPGKVFNTVGTINGTRDGGATWTELPTGFLPDLGVVEIVVSPTDANTATAFTFGRTKDPSGNPNLTTFSAGLGVIKTTNGGSTWQRLDSGTSGNISVSVSRLSPSHVFRITTDAHWQFSSDGGATYLEVNNGNVFNARAGRLNPYDPTGLSGLCGGDFGHVYAISNGTTLTPVGSVANSPQLATTRFQWFEFGPDGAWYASGYYTGTVNGAFKQEGFVFRSRDNGATWTRIVNSATMVGPTTLFSDDPLTPGTTIKAAHLTELRSYVDELRNRFGLLPFGWTDPVITVGTSRIKAIHLLELRTALSEAYIASGRAAPGYTGAISVGAVISAAPITELRAFITAIY